MWRCPTCQSKDHLEVVVETWTRLIQPDDEPEEFQTDSDDTEMGGDQEWGANSVMACVNSECSDYMETHIAEYFDIDSSEYGKE